MKTITSLLKMTADEILLRKRSLHVDQNFCLVLSMKSNKADLNISSFFEDILLSHREPSNRLTETSNALVVCDDNQISQSLL